MLIQQHNMSRLVLLPRIIHREGVRAYHFDLLFCQVLCRFLCQIRSAVVCFIIVVLMTPGIYENQISVLYCSVPFLRSAGRRL